VGAVGAAGPSGQDRPAAEARCSSPEGPALAQPFSRRLVSRAYRLFIAPTLKVAFGPKHAFKMGPVNGRKGRESDRSRYGQDAHNRSFADGRRTGSITTRRSPGSRPAGPSPSGWSISVDPGPMIGTYEP
jgi:hypothetical protein